MPCLPRTVAAYRSKKDLVGGYYCGCNEMLSRLMKSETGALAHPGRRPAAQGSCGAVMASRPTSTLCIGAIHMMKRAKRSGGWLEYLVGMIVGGLAVLLFVASVQLTAWIVFRLDIRTPDLQRGRYSFAWDPFSNTTTPKQCFLRHSYLPPARRPMVGVRHRVNTLPATISTPPASHSACD
jgi:hypothetical protein